MIDLKRVLLEGAWLSLLFVVILLGSLYVNPRMWLHDYPNDIQQAVRPKTDTEKKQLAIYGSCVMALMLVPFITSLYDGGNVTYMNAFLHFFIVFMMISLADLILVNWLVFCSITPKFIIIPGTGGMKSYKDYMFHFKGFLKSIVIFGIFNLILAGIRVTINLI